VGIGLRTGDTINGHIRSPKEGERYFLPGPDDIYVNRRLVEGRGNDLALDRAR
jgi:hypothetical protein